MVLVTKHPSDREKFPLDSSLHFLLHLDSIYRVFINRRRGFPASAGGSVPALAINKIKIKEWR